MLIRLPGTVPLVLLGLGLMPVDAAAQTPALVSVGVELVERRYRERFPNRTAVEAKAAALFADYLTREVGYLRFAVNDTTAPSRLLFLLDRRERGTTDDFFEAGFWVRLIRSDADTSDTYWLRLRSADQSLARVGSEADFLAEIGTKLEHQDAEALQTEVLSRIPIAETGLPNLNPLGLVLPFRRMDLCMRNQSVVLFVAEIRGGITTEETFKARIVGDFSPAGPQPPEMQPFLNGGFGKVIDLGTPDQLSPSIMQKAVTVKQVFVVSYLHDPTACRNRAPAPVGAGTP